VSEETMEGSLFSVFNVNYGLDNSKKSFNEECRHLKVEGYQCNADRVGKSTTCWSKYDHRNRKFH